MRELWGRASLEMNTRPIKVTRNISRKDLLIPKGPSMLRMLLLTFAGGVSMAMLYVWPPLMVVVILSTAGIGAWFWIAIAIAALVAWMTLFTLAVRESAAERRYAEKMHIPG